MPTPEQILHEWQESINNPQGPPLCIHAADVAKVADEVTRLQARVAELEEALVEETARRMWAEDNLDEVSARPHEWSAVYDKEYWRREARADLSVKE